MVRAGPTRPHRCQCSAASVLIYLQQQSHELLYPAYSAPRSYSQPDDSVESKRREYLEALHRQQQSREYQYAVALENQCHRAQLTVLAKCGVLRKRVSTYQLHPFSALDNSFHDPGRACRASAAVPKSQPRPAVIWRLLAEFPLDQIICKL